MSSQGFGLIPGSNTSGTQISVPYAPQQGGQASLGGTMNPFLPVTTGTSTSIPMMPQGAVSSSATSGLPTSVSSTQPSGMGSSLGASSSAPLLPYQSAGAPTGTGSPVPIGSAPGAGAPTQGPTSAGATTPTSAGAALGVPTTTGGENKLLQTLNKAYGAGLGTTLYNFLASGAGYNQTAINNLIAALQPGYEMDQQNLLASFSAGGNRFSSGAQLGESNLMGQEQLNIGQLETQMYEQSVSDYINVMLGAASGSNARKLQAGAAQSSLIGNLVQGALSTGELAAGV